MSNLNDIICNNNKKKHTTYCHWEWELANCQRCDWQAEQVCPWHCSDALSYNIVWSGSIHDMYHNEIGGNYPVRHVLIFHHQRDLQEVLPQESNLYHQRQTPPWPCQVAAAIRKNVLEPENNYLQVQKQLRPINHQALETIFHNPNHNPHPVLNYYGLYTIEGAPCTLPCTVIV